MRSTQVREGWGQAIVEMALVLPVLLLLLLGVVEFGLAFNAKQAVTNAAREGARLAVVNDPAITADSVTTSIETSLARAGLSAGDAAIQFNTTTNWRTPGQMQTVDVGVPYRFGFLGSIAKAATGSETITLRARVSMRNQP